MVSGGMELIFFIAASVVLSFGSVLITHWYTSYSWTASRPLFLILSHQPVPGGCTRNWKGSQPGLMNPNEQRYSIPHGIVLCQKIQGKEGWRGGCSLMVLVYPSNYYMWWSMTFLEMSKCWSADKKWWMSYLSYFHCISPSVHISCWINSTVFFQLS